MQWMRMVLWIQLLPYQDTSSRGSHAWTARFINENDTELRSGGGSRDHGSRAASSLKVTMPGSESNRSQLAPKTDVEELLLPVNCHDHTR
jgi:hypothetical protein